MPRKKFIEPLVRCSITLYVETHKPKNSDENSKTGTKLPRRSTGTSRAFQRFNESTEASSKNLRDDVIQRQRQLIAEIGKSTTDQINHLRIGKISPIEPNALTHARKTAEVLAPQQDLMEEAIEQIHRAKGEAIAREKRLVELFEEHQEREAARDLAAEKDRRIANDRYRKESRKTSWTLFAAVATLAVTVLSIVFEL